MSMPDPYKRLVIHSQRLQRNKLKALKKKKLETVLAREGKVSERATVWELNDRQEKKGTAQVNIQAMLLDVYLTGLLSLPEEVVFPTAL